MKILPVNNFCNNSNYRKRPDGLTFKQGLSEKEALDIILNNTFQELINKGFKLFAGIKKRINEIKGLTSKDIKDFMNLGVEQQFSSIFDNLKDETGQYNPQKISLYKDFLKLYSGFQTPLDLSRIVGRYISNNCSNDEVVNSYRKYIKCPRIMEYLDCCLANNNNLIDDEKVSFYEEFISRGISQDVLQEFLWRNTDITEVGFKTANDSFEIAKQKLLHLRDEAILKKNILSTGRILEDKAIDRLFLLEVSPSLTMFALHLVGEANIVHSFKDKILNLENYLVLLGKHNFSIQAYNDEVLEKLIELVNPTNSKCYKASNEMIKKLKSELETVGETEKQQLIYEINKYSRIKNSLLKNSIKDPEAAMKLAIMYKSLYNINPEYAIEIYPYINPKNSEDLKTFYNKLNEMVFKILGFGDEISDNTKQKFDFSNSKYLSAIFASHYDFKNALKSLILLLDKEPNSSVSEILNKLPQNIETKRQFEQLGIDYDAWCGFNPKSKIEFEISSNVENIRKNAVKNLEEEFDDPMIWLIDKKEMQKIIDAIEAKGYSFAEKSLCGLISKTFIQKSGKRIEFKDVRKIIHIIKEEFNRNSYWTRSPEESDVYFAKRSFMDHINYRYNEVKYASGNNIDSKYSIVIQKVDMNDIKHSLFLGNHSGCCTSVNGVNGWSAPNYIKNKLINAIEIKDGDEAIGNTMCYIAEVDGKLSLVLDNIELKPKYQYNALILDGLIRYAKQLTKEIGCEDMAIYAGPNRHKLDLSAYEKKGRMLKIIGSTGDDWVYLDFDTTSHLVDGEEWQDGIEMYKLY